jgi:GxxExxY protein
MKKDPRTHAIIGTAIEVHNIIGPGHLEAVYQECLEIEFGLRKIQYIAQPRLEIFYKDLKLKK